MNLGWRYTTWAQRKLFELFAKVAKKTQVIYTTHMPGLVPVGRVDRLRVLEHEPGGRVRVEPKAHKQSAGVPCSHTGLHEDLVLLNATVFWAGTLIVEGGVDMLFLTYLEALG